MDQTSREFRIQTETFYVRWNKRTIFHGLKMEVNTNDDHVFVLNVFLFYSRQFHDQLICESKA